MIRCTVGVMAYNEERNIVQVLHALLNQRDGLCSIEEIIVVASGCTDRTVELAGRVAQTHPVVQVDVQPQRHGKAAAINRLMAIARCDVIVLVGADTLPDPTALGHLVQPFTDPSVGMTGARVVPLNDPRTFLGFTVQMLWQVHHSMALRWPKLGELVAFRKVIGELPANSATDEVALEAMFTALGYRLVYAPEAVVYNRGPETLDDYIIQRRRIFAGHLHIASAYHYVAASVPLAHLLALVRDAVRLFPGRLPWTAGAVALECWGRALGVLDHMLGRSHHIWRSAPSTKQVHEDQSGFALIAFDCSAGTIKLDDLMRITRYMPPSRGTLFWWDRQRHQMMFKVPTDQSAHLSLEDHTQQLAAYVVGESRSAQCALSVSRVVQFASPRPTQAGSPCGL